MAELGGAEAAVQFSRRHGGWCAPRDTETPSKGGGIRSTAFATPYEHEALMERYLRALAMSFVAGVMTLLLLMVLHDAGVEPGVPSLFDYRIRALDGTPAWWF